MEKINESLEKAKWIVELIGYSYEGPDVNGNYDVLADDFIVGQICHNGEEYDIKIDRDDIYDVDKKKSEYFIDKLQGKNKDYGISISVDDKETTVILYIPVRNQVFRKQLSLSFGQNKAFRIAYEGQSVKLSGNYYTIKTTSEEKTITESQEESGVLCIAKQKSGKDKYGYRYPINRSSISQTLAEYISSDEVGTKLFQRFSNIIANFGFTKSLIEVIGENILASSGLSLLGNPSDTEKASGVQKKKTDDKKKKTGE